MLISDVKILFITKIAFSANDQTEEKIFDAGQVKPNDYLVNIYYVDYLYIIYIFIYFYFV